MFIVLLPLPSPNYTVTPDNVIIITNQNIITVTIVAEYSWCVIDSIDSTIVISYVLAS